MQLKPDVVRDVLLFLEENLCKQPSGYVLGEISRGLSEKYNNEKLEETLIQLYHNDMIDGVFVFDRNKELEFCQVKEITSQGEIYLQQQQNNT